MFNMKHVWFKKIGWFYLPIHPMGFAVLLGLLLFMVPIVAATIRTGNSVSDNLYQLFVYSSCTLFWGKWIAENTCDKA